MNTSIECYNQLIAAIHRHDPMTTVCHLYACYVIATLGGNITRASRELRVHRRTLHRWQRVRKPEGSAA